ncbi:serine/threonine protein kinase [Streptomyces sp. KAU_LT]|uniref:serine/threonine protein kinase n=1 Tax=Streptomyces sp. KAU_LT TaxID=3046669 RepID=UPI0024B7E0FD|nr:serine/threonine protein kinase [Streptomyces sp. KAU_LT]MDI9835329.1 serine/threonine protein kinase [Streptomyces sp. KAU_LT]
METIIVQPSGPSRPGATGAGAPELLRLGPGDVAEFGRDRPGGRTGPFVALRDPGVSRRAGRLEAARDYWRLSNFSAGTAYVVENMENGGEYLTVAPGRLGAPVPFELSRVVLPALEGGTGFTVFAPQHTYLDERETPGATEQTAHPFALDVTAKYFLVLVALCEPRLRGVPDGAPPGAGDIARRLRPLDGCGGLTRSAVNYHIDYLARAKLPLDGDAGDGAGRTGAKRTRLASLALRYGLVREEHLALLPSRRRRGPGIHGPR